jgi:hypothetical protein
MYYSNKTFKIKFRIIILKDRFLIAVKCRNGWTQYKTKCLKVFDETNYYSEAKQICTENNATMISIEDLEENEFVAKLTEKSAPQAKFLWIGAKRTGSGLLDFDWENGEPFLYSNWMSGQPNNRDGNQNFVYVSLAHRTWVDWIDGGLFGTVFMCESTLTDE